VCVIIDTQLLHQVFRNVHPNYSDVNRFLSQNKIQLVYGGKLKREYVRLGWFRRLLLRLDQQGSARKVDDVKVDSESVQVSNKGLCISNDPHIVALARISGARILCSMDIDLIEDFGNKELIDDPRGKFYKNSSHNHLLRKYCKTSWKAK